MAEATRREFMLGAGSSAAVMGAGISLGAFPAAAAAPAVAFDPAMHVHPELRASVPDLQRITAQNGSPTMEGLAAARAAQFEPPPLPQPAWTERTIVGLRSSRLRVANAFRDGASQSTAASSSTQLPITSS